MKLRILGPVQAFTPGGEALRCSGRPLKLLALLLVDGSHAVPADVAIEALWGDGLPANPPNALQITVSRLRNVLGEESVLRRAGGYELRLDGPDSVDAERFERLASEGARRWRAVTTRTPPGNSPRRSSSGAAGRCRTCATSRSRPARPFASRAWARASTPTSRSAGTRSWSASCRR